MQTMIPQIDEAQKAHTAGHASVWHSKPRGRWVAEFQIKDEALQSAVFHDFDTCKAWLDQQLDGYTLTRKVGPLTKNAYYVVW